VHRLARCIAARPWLYGSLSCEVGGRKRRINGLKTEGYNEGTISAAPTCLTAVRAAPTPLAVASRSVGEPAGQIRRAALQAIGILEGFFQGLRAVTRLPDVAVPRSPAPDIRSHARAAASRRDAMAQ
jgi:hypothetical protein